MRSNLCTIDTPASALEKLQKYNRQRGQYEEKQPKPLGLLVTASMAAQIHRKSSILEDTGKLGHIGTHLVPERKRFHCSDHAERVRRFVKAYIIMTEIREKIMI